MSDDKLTINRRAEILNDILTRVEGNDPKSQLSISSDTFDNWLMGKGCQKGTLIAFLEKSIDLNIWANDFQMLEFLRTFDYINRSDIIKILPEKKKQDWVNKKYWTRRCGLKARVHPYIERYIEDQVRLTLVEKSENELPAWRVVFIDGLPNIGKSQMVRSICQHKDVSERYRDGIFFIDNDLLQEFTAIDVLGEYLEIPANSQVKLTIAVREWLADNYKDALFVIDGEKALKEFAPIVSHAGSRIQFLVTLKGMHFGKDQVSDCLQTSSVYSVFLKHLEKEELAKFSQNMHPEIINLLLNSCYPLSSYPENATKIIDHLRSLDLPDIGDTGASQIWDPFLEDHYTYEKIIRIWFDKITSNLEDDIFEILQLIIAQARKFKKRNISIWPDNYSKEYVDYALIVLEALQIIENSDEGWRFHDDVYRLIELDLIGKPTPSYH